MLLREFARKRGLESGRHDALCGTPMSNIGILLADDDDAVDDSKEFLKILLADLKYSYNSIYLALAFYSV